jgi:hypothetical protein
MRFLAARATLLMLLLVLAACNLVSISAQQPASFATPPPAGGEDVQINIVTATPGAIQVTATPFGVVVNPTPVSGSVQTSPALPSSSGNAVDWLINAVILPAWNFLYTLFMRSVGSLFDFAGARGGVFAQVLCCIVPIVIAAVLLARYFMRGRQLI